MVHTSKQVRKNDFMCWAADALVETTGEGCLLQLKTTMAYQFKKACDDQHFNALSSLQ